MRSLFSSLAVIAVLASGCSSSSQPAPAEHSWNADFGKWGKDPVAQKLILRQTAIKRDYQGVTYYFENGDEAQQFESNPTAYVGQPATSEQGQETRHQTSVHSR
jgi:YHS domain-containing protein